MNINNITIVINSHKNNVLIALQQLLDSIIMHNKYKYKIVVIVGGNEYTTTELYDTHKVINVTHNSIDFTGLITIVENNSIIDTSFIFYIHDTCKVGPRFFTYIDNLSLKPDTTISFAYPSMNMGVYPISVINNNKIELLKLKNNSTDINDIHKFKAHGVPIEGFIFNNNPRNILIRSRCTVSAPYDYYKTGVLRIVEYYSDVDLYKIKANWHVKQKYELNL